MNIKSKFILAVIYFLFSVSAMANEFYCPINDIYENFGYEVSYVETSYQILTNLNDLNKSTYVFMSPDEINKYDLAIIFDGVSNCVKKIQEEYLCVHLKDGMKENPFLMVCNWYVEDGIVQRYK